MGPQPGPRLVEVKTGGSGEGRLPVGTNTANRLTTNRFFLPIPASLLPQPHLPAPGAQAASQPQAPSSAARPLGSALARCCQGDGGPTQEQVCTSSPSPPGHGKQSSEKTEKRYSAYEGWHGARCGPWPTEPEPCLCLTSPPSPVLRTGATPAQDSTKACCSRGMGRPNPKPGLARGIPLNVGLFQSMPL